MRFIMTEDAWERFGTYAYRGVIGLFYDSTLGGVLSMIIFALLVLFAVIGIISALKWVFFRHSSKEDPGKKWLRTGRF